MTVTHPQTHTTWLDALEPRLVDKSTIPHLNMPELFSMEEMAKRLGNLFHLASGELSLGLLREVKEVSVTKQPVISYGYRIGAIPELVYWVIHRDEAERLITLLLKGKQEIIPQLDDDLVDAFMRYLSLEILLHLRALGFHDALLVECIGSTLPPQTTTYLELALSWNIQDALFTSNIILPPAFITHWNHYFEQQHHQKPLSEARAEQVSVVVHLDIGNLFIQQKEWEETQIGDFLLLDHCTYAPGKSKGRVRLSASTIPLFRAMIKEGSIKLLEQSVYQEMEPSMSNKLPDDLTDVDRIEESFDETSQEENYLDEDSLEQETDQYLEEDSEFTEEELFQDPPPSSHSQTLQHPEPAPLKSDEEPLTPLEQIPFTVNIEVGRIKMSLANLRKLEPGQMLDISIEPEKGVDLVLEGRTIGRGELLSLGESIGVRVTELG